MTASITYNNRRPGSAVSGSANLRPARSSANRLRTTALLLLFLPLLAHAQASPFETGATSLQNNLLTIMTPIAIILVIALGIGAMVNRISWTWAVAAIAGIALTFGAPQIVGWIRGAFGV
jgi:type IV secretion system protein VirB2